MKKILTTIVFILICYFGYGQYPIIQNLGGPTTLVKNPNYGGTQGGLIPFTFADTSSANSLAPYLKTYGGALIYTISPPAIWYRYIDSVKWVQILPSGSSTSGTNGWLVGGNYNVLADGAFNATFGTLQNNGIYFKTNNTTRLLLDKAGLTFNQVVSDTTLNKVLTYNTSTKAIGYGYWYGGGSSSTPTWQETLTAGSTLNTDNTIDGGGYIFNFSNAGEFFVGTTASAYLSTNYLGNYSQVGTSIGGSSSLSSTRSGLSSVIETLPDSIRIQPSRGNLFIDTLTNVAARYVLHYNPTTGLVSYADTTASSSGANTALSNLASVAVNTSIIPGVNNSIALGTTAKIWSDVQADYFHTGGLNANYGGYSGAILGGVSNGAVLDFFHANTRIGEFYTLSSSFNFFTGAGKALNFYTNNSTSIPLLTGSGTSAQLGVNMTTPTAQFHISAGSTAAGSSPIKFTAGTNMTAAEAGAMEWDGTNLFITQTTGPTRKTIAYTTDLTGLPYWALTGTSSLTGASTIDMAGFDLTINNSAANDEVFLVAVNPGLVEFKLVADTKKAYLLSGAIAAGSAGDALTVVDPTTGEIGVAPNLAFNFQKEKTMIYAKNGRLFAEDADKNVTQISPHNDKGEWIYKSTDKNGITTEINMIRLAELLEKVTGEKLIYKTKE